MKIEQILSLTLKRQAFRKHAQIGALEIMGYPVYPMLRFFEGYDQLDYEGDAWIAEAVADGFPCFESAALEFIKGVHGIVTWGHLSILRDIVATQKTTLVLEDDTHLTIRYEALQTELNALGAKAPVAPEIVLLGFPPRYRDRDDLIGVEGADFWVQGVKGGVQSSLIITPSAAAEILEYYAARPLGTRNIEMLLQHVWHDKPYIYASRDDLRHATILQGRSIMYHNTLRPDTRVSNEKHVNRTLKASEFFGISDNFEV